MEFYGSKTTKNSRSRCTRPDHQIYHASKEF